MNAYLLYRLNRMLGVFASLEEAKVGIQQLIQFHTGWRARDFRILIHPIGEISLRKQKREMLVHGGDASYEEFYGKPYLT